MGRKVCVIDGDEDMREVLARIVRSAGLVPDLYDSAESFLRRSERSVVGCMLVDVDFHGTNGAALLERVINDRIEIPVFLISGAHDAVVAATAKRLGAVIVDKPFNTTVLVERIRAAVRAAPS